MSIVKTLKEVSKGLLMTSESDYPFEVILWEGKAKEPLTVEKMLQVTNHSRDTSVEIVDLDYLFRNAAQEKEWHDEQQKATVKQFKLLLETLKNNLSDLQVYRVGTIEVDVYIVGKNESNLVGLSTKLIET
jgi:hypothetical protein